MSKIKLVINNTNQQREKEKFFIKKELQSILNLYAKMVSNGSWKDYSFSSGIKEVSFNVYQRASEKPVIRISKNLKPKYFNERYFIKDKDGNVKAENVPESVKENSEHTWTKTGTENVYQEIDQDKIVPLLVKSLQEALTEIDTLKTKVAALENA